MNQDDAVVYRPTLLFVTPWYPDPPLNGSRCRVQQLLLALIQVFDVTLVTFQPSEGPGDREHLIAAGYGSKIVVIDEPPFALDPLRRLLGLVSRTPRDFFAYRTAALHRGLEEATSRGSYDVVIASTLRVAPASSQVPARLHVLEEHNFLSRQLKELLESEAHAKDARWRQALRLAKDLAYERKVFSAFDLVTMVSEQDRQAVVDLGCAVTALDVVPNGVAPATAAERKIEPELDTLIYTGSMTYDANRDAVAWFLDAIWPRIRDARPSVRFRVTGSTDGIDLSEFGEPAGVEFLGHVEDIRATVAEHWLSVVPLRLGGGTRLKVLESMALGTPVVSTRKGCEGLNITAGSEVRFADDPEAFAREVLRLLEDEPLRGRISESGRARVESDYDWRDIGDAFAAKILALVEAKRSGS